MSGAAKRADQGGRRGARGVVRAVAVRYPVASLVVRPLWSRGWRGGRCWPTGRAGSSGPRRPTCTCSGGLAARSALRPCYTTIRDSTQMPPTSTRHRRSWSVVSCPPPGSARVRSAWGEDRAPVAGCRRDQHRCGCRQQQPRDACQPPSGIGAGPMRPFCLGSILAGGERSHDHGNDKQQRRRRRRGAALGALAVRVQGGRLDLAGRSRVAWLRVVPTRAGRRSPAQAMRRGCAPAQP